MLKHVEKVVCSGFGGVEIPGFSCHGDGVDALELYRCEPAKLAVTASLVVPDLEVVEDHVGEFDVGLPLLRSSSSTCMRGQNDPIIELS